MKSLITSVKDLKQIRNVKDGIIEETGIVEEPTVVERKNIAPTDTKSVTPSKTTPPDDYDDVKYIPRLEDSSRMKYQQKLFKTLIILIQTYTRQR